MHSLSMIKHLLNRALQRRHTGEYVQVLYCPGKYAFSQVSPELWLVESIVVASSFENYCIKSTVCTEEKHGNPR